MNDPTLPLEGLSPVNGKAIVARFDGGSLSSDSGLIALAEVEKRLRVAATLAACIDDPRRPRYGLPQARRDDRLSDVHDRSRL